MRTVVNVQYCHSLVVYSAIEFWDQIGARASWKMKLDAFLNILVFDFLLNIKVVFSHFFMVKNVIHLFKTHFFENFVLKCFLQKPKNIFHQDKKKSDTVILPPNVYEKRCYVKKSIKPKNEEKHPVLQ